jgi:hypothetical protein
LRYARLEDAPRLVEVANALHRGVRWKRVRLQEATAAGNKQLRSWSTQPERPSDPAKESIAAATCASMTIRSRSSTFAAC